MNEENEIALLERKVAAGRDDAPDTPPVTVPEPQIAPEPGIMPEPKVDPKPGIMPQPGIMPEPKVDPEPGITPQPGIMPEPQTVPEPEISPLPEIAPQPPVISPRPTVAPPPAINDGSDGRSGQKSGAFIALCAVLCTASLAAFVCVGMFAADALSRAGHTALYSTFAVPAAVTDAATEAAPTPEAPSTPPSVLRGGERSRGERNEAQTDASPQSADVRPIERVSLAPDDPFTISNMTSYEPDVAALTAAETFAAFAPVAPDAPSVLVIHTHATEAYTPEGVTEYDESTGFRSADAAESIIAVGDEICAVLEASGIKTLHCTRQFDAEDFEHAYDLTAAAVREYLASYPTVRLVLDVHRDAIFGADGTLLAPTSADGAAQVMLVCGTDEQGAIFPDWRDNLSFAFRVQAAAEAKYPDLMRGVNLRGASFNEQLAERYLLVEVGSAGNTLAEAKAGARKFADTLAAVIGK